MTTRGIRGATQISEDSPDAILDATRELLSAILDANPALDTEDIASIFFTVTHDLNAAHPALAARQLGWVDVPLLCAQEIPVPNSMPRVVRVLIHWNTDRPQKEINHVYLGRAAALRPDLQIPARPSLNGHKKETVVIT
ncbi:MAG: chorismate mutase [Anaerolineales bacterium]|nr:chorismate mutase [Anaerolineales bacterium]